MSNKGHQAISSYVDEIQKIVSCVVKEVCFPYKNNEGYLVLGWSGELRLEDERFKHFNLHRRHIPSGRVPLEDVIRWLITELEVVPIRENWEEILVETREKFMASQSWFYGKSDKR